MCRGIKGIFGVIIHIWMKKECGGTLRSLFLWSCTNVNAVYCTDINTAVRIVIRYGLKQ